MQGKRRGRSRLHRSVPKMDDCDACGFHYALSEAQEAGPAIERGVAELARIIAEQAHDAARRREPSTWSPLEYGCHVRDVLTVQRERALLARRRKTPSVEPMGRDERGEHDGYAEQDPSAVATQLTQMAALMANVLGRLQPADWELTMIYNYPEVAERSLRWLAIHTRHEVEHHLLDVQRQLV